MRSSEPQEGNDLVSQLGMNLQNPSEMLALNLVDEDADFMRNLITVRESAGVSAEELAERMGTSVERVEEFEAYWADPSLSIIRRYAHALGVSYSHEVFPPQITTGR